MTYGQVQTLHFFNKKKLKNIEAEAAEKFRTNYEQIQTERKGSIVSTVIQNKSLKP